MYRPIVNIMDKLLFPFVSIVGQDDMKRALLLNIVDPGIGGALIKGEKGTAKSTTVRSLAQILPPRRRFPDVRSTAIRTTRTCSAPTAQKSSRRTEGWIPQSSRCAWWSFL